MANVHDDFVSFYKFFILIGRRRNFSETAVKDVYFAACDFNCCKKISLGLEKPAVAERSSTEPPRKPLSHFRFRFYYAFDFPFQTLQSTLLFFQLVRSAHACNSQAIRFGAEKSRRLKHFLRDFNSIPVMRANSA